MREEGGKEKERRGWEKSEEKEEEKKEFAKGKKMSRKRSGVAAVRIDVAEEAPRIRVLGGGISTEVIAVDAQTGARAARRRQ